MSAYLDSIRGGFYAYMRMKKTDEPVEVVSLENAE